MLCHVVGFVSTRRPKDRFPSRSGKGQTWTAYGITVVVGRAVRVQRSTAVAVAVSVPIAVAMHDGNPWPDHGVVGSNSADVLARQAAMNRDSLAGVRAAEDFAVLSEVGEQPAVRDVGLDVDVQEVLRERVADGRRPSAADLHRSERSRGSPSDSEP